MVAILLCVQPLNRPPHSRAGKLPGKDVPTVIENHRVFLTPRHHEGAIGCGGNSGIRANVRACVDKELIAGGRAIGIKKPPIDVNTVPSSGQIPAPVNIHLAPLPFGNPHDDKAPVRKSRNCGRALIERRELIDLEFTVRLCSGLSKHLRIDSLKTVHVVLSIAAVGDDNIAACQGGDDGIDLIMVGGGAHHYIVIGIDECAAGVEKIAVDVLKTLFAALPDECRAAVF